MIVEACLAGERKAFEVLVDRYEKKLYNAAYRVLGDSEDAMEATQSAFVKAYERLGTFDTSQRFFPWMYRILVNESLNIVNRRKRFEELDSRFPCPGGVRRRNTATRKSPGTSRRRCASSRRTTASSSR